MRTAVPHVSIAMLLSTLAADAAAQQRAPLLHPEQQKATSQKMVAPRNSLEALDRHFSQLDRRRLVVRPGPRVVNPKAARVQPNPQLVRTLEAHGRTLRVAPAAHPQQGATTSTRETSAVLPGGNCEAMRRSGVEVDRRVLDMRPAEGGFLSPGVEYEAYGCSLGKSVVPRATTMTDPGPANRDFVATAVIHAWSDSRLAFTLLEVPKAYDFLFWGLRAQADTRVSSATVEAHFVAVYLAPRVSNAVAIPPAAVTVSTSPAGSPAVSVPMDFYGLRGAVGVARQSPGGLLAGQDSVEIRLARDVVLESVQLQYLAYDAAGASSVSAPTNVSFVQEGDQYVRSVAKIRVNWPVNSVVPQGQSQAIFYSVYALNITLKGPKGMPAFDGIPSIVLN